MPWREPVERIAEREAELENRLRLAVRRLVVGYLILFLGIGLGAWRFQTLVARVERDGAKQVRQFCELNVARVVDRERQVDTTRTYLGTAVGMERTGLNDYIRRFSFPTIVKQTRAERRQLPDDCTAIYVREHRQAARRTRK